jgi:anti-sigma28 factor (negative regulator of flagellin synthesis)
MTNPVSSSLPATVTDRAAGPAAAAGSAAADAAPAGTGAGGDSVELSDHAAAAATMLSAAEETGSGGTDPALARIAQDIADGIYKPPPAAIAEALVRYETGLLRGG